MEDVTFEGGIDMLVEELAGPRRRNRQEAAHRIALASHEDAGQLAPHIDALIDALYRPEAQTRWEVFDALFTYALIDPDAVSGAIDGAEAALFDEDSAIVRLAAFRLLSRLGASSPERSEQVWPLLDEAVQCYHGNPEYRDMLLVLLEFAKGDLSDDVREALCARMAFDGENGRSYIKGYSNQILAAAKGEE